MSGDALAVGRQEPAAAGPGIISCTWQAPGEEPGAGDTATLPATGPGSHVGPTAAALIASH